MEAVMKSHLVTRIAGIALILLAVGISTTAEARGRQFGRDGAQTPAASTTASTPTGQGRGYINSKGQWVPSPTRTTDGKAPKGATAKCADGTYSFSQSRRGTCSHHGGVAQWQPPGLTI